MNALRYNIIAFAVVAAGIRAFQPETTPPVSSDFSGFAGLTALACASEKYTLPNIKDAILGTAIVCGLNSFNSNATGTASAGAASLPKDLRVFAGCGETNTQAFATTLGFEKL